MIKCDNVGKAIINRPPNHYFDRWYGYHSQSWVVYGIVLPTWHQDFPWNKPSIFHIFTGFSIRSSTFMGFSISHHIFLGYSIYIYIPLFYIYPMAYSLYIYTQISHDIPIFVAICPQRVPVLLTGGGQIAEEAWPHWKPSCRAGAMIL